MGRLQSACRLRCVRYRHACSRRRRSSATAMTPCPSSPTFRSLISCPSRSRRRSRCRFRSHRGSLPRHCLASIDRSRPCLARQPRRCSRLLACRSAHSVALDGAERSRLADERVPIPRCLARPTCRASCRLSSSRLSSSRRNSRRSNSRRSSSRRSSSRRSSRRRRRRRRHSSSSSIQAAHRLRAGLKRSPLCPSICWTRSRRCRCTPTLRAWPASSLRPRHRRKRAPPPCPPRSSSHCPSHGRRRRPRARAACRSTLHEPRPRRAPWVSPCSVLRPPPVPVSTIRRTPTARGREHSGATRSRRVVRRLR